MSSLRKPEKKGCLRRAQRLERTWHSVCYLDTLSSVTVTGENGRTGPEVLLDQVTWQEDQRARTKTLRTGSNSSRGTLQGLSRRGYLLPVPSPTPQCLAIYASLAHRRLQDSPSPHHPTHSMRGEGKGAPIKYLKMILIQSNKLSQNTDAL